LSTIKVNNIQSRTGSAISFTSGDTITIPSGATLTNNGTASGFGKIVQYKIVRAESQFDSTSATLAEIDGNLRTTITPTSASNKIVIKFNCAWIDNYAGGTEAILSFYRSINGGTYNNMGTEDSNTANVFYNWNASRFQIFQSFTYIDTNHNTTSPIIYTPYGRANTSLQVRFGTSDRFSSMEVMEVLA
jgi:hypothetical protein